jgi:hypothetical protein
LARWHALVGAGKRQLCPVWGDLGVISGGRNRLFRVALLQSQRDSVRVRCDIWRTTMDKKIAGLLGAVAGWVTMGAANAATAPASNPSEALEASSYADLLAPVHNAVALVKADDTARQREQQRAPEGAQQDVPEGNMQLADWGGGYYRHHHHHHHHQAYRHHHHHHHHTSYIGIPGVGGVVVR